MREKIFELAKEVWNRDQPSIEVVAQDLQIEAQAGSVLCGVFHIKTDDGRPVRGRAYIHGKTRLKLTQPDFSGEDCILPYEFCAEGLLCGEAQKCMLEIYSNCGYLKEECKVQVILPYVESSIGRLDDLTRFAELCEKNFREALKIFTGKEFKRVFLSSDERLSLIYEGLLDGESGASALEEFLIAAHLKQKLYLSAKKNHLSFYNIMQEQEEILLLSRNTWGYGKYYVTSKTAFLKTDRNLIWVDSFVRNQCSLGVSILPQYLHRGRNRGVLEIYSSTDRLEITFEIEQEMSAEELAARRARRYEKEAFLQIFRGFTGLLAGHFKDTVYTHRQRLILDKGTLELPTEYKNLMEIHLLFQEERQAEAAEKLRCMKAYGEPIMAFGELCRGKIEENSITPEEERVYAVYLYLGAVMGISDSEDGKAAVFLNYLKELKNSRPTHRWYVYLYTAALLAVSREQAGTLEDCIADMAALQDNSPIGYLLACSIWNVHPKILTRMDSFSIPALYAGEKYKMLSKSLKAQFLYLAGGTVSYYPLVYNTLVKMYEEKASDDVLSAILKHLIRGKQVGSRYNQWLRLGVEKRMRITELYEYFVYSMKNDDMGKLPAPLLIYFQYACTLPDGKKAALYANIISNKGSDPQTYLNYLPQIERFALEQVACHRISTNLSVIYEDVLNNTNIDADSQAHLIQIMFRREIRCSEPQIKGVYILYEELDQEEYVPFQNGKAIANLMDDSAVLLFEDQDGCRHYSTEYTIRRLFRLDQLCEKCMENYTGDERMFLPLLKKAQRKKDIGAAGRDALEKALYRNFLQDEVKERLYIQLLEYAYENFEEEHLQELLSMDMQLGFVSVKQLVELCISIGGTSEDGKHAMEKAYELVMDSWQYGMLHMIAVQKLAQLVHWRFLGQPELTADGLEDEEHAMLCAACHILFLNKAADKEQMFFLMRNIDGPVGELLSIYRSPHVSGDEFKKERCMLSQKILVLALFADMELVPLNKIFTAYYMDRESFKYTEHYHLAELVIRAYLFVYASRYLHDTEPECAPIFDAMFEEIRHARLVAGKYALLKYFSKQKDYTQEQISWIELSAKECIEDGVVFPFFKDFSLQVRLPAAVRNASYLSYTANPHSVVTLHYCYEITGRKGHFEAQVMKNRFQGIYVRSFILFYDEKLKYYITEEQDGKEINRTKVMEISEEKEVGGSENSFEQINMILAAKDVGDDVSMRREMQHYIQTSYAQKTLFKPFL